MSTLRTDNLQTLDSSFQVAVKDLVSNNPVSIAELKLLPKGEVTRIAHVVDPALGFNEFYYIDLADTTSVNNNGMVIVADDGGRWKLLDQRYISGQFYTNYGALVHKFGDRAQFGDAVNANADTTMDQTDWFTIYMRDKGREYSFSTSANVLMTNNLNDNASNTLVVASHTGDLVAGWNAIGIIACGVGNATSGTGHAYAGYFEAYRDVGVSGGAYGIEIDTMNYGSLSDTDPYIQPTNQTIGLQVAAGGEFPSLGQFDCSAAINIRRNGAGWYRGIVFGADSLTGTDGVSGGTAVAIALAKGHKFQWYGGTGVGTAAIFSTGTTSAQAQSIELGDNFTRWNSAAGAAFEVESSATSVNHLSARAQNTGLPAQLLAKGPGADVDMQLVPKGTGSVWLGPHTAGALTPTGYITVKDSAGVSRRLLVG